MEFQHFTHDYPLEEIYWAATFGPCSGCYLPSHGPGYKCQTCNFRLHKSCFGMPREISHPCHPHSLNLLYQPPNAENFPKCDQCRSVCFGLIYHCKGCEFNLDIKCASFTENDCHHQSLELLKSEAKDMIFHTLHPSHPLFFFYCRQEFELECKPCEQPLSGPAYRCIDKDCTFFAHESCTKLPEAIRHPYHPHRLLLQSGSYSIGCGACRCKIYGSCYRCARGCNFELDILCSKFSPPAIKLNRHEHNLFYFDDNGGPSGSVLCNDCSEELSGTIYSCVRCEDFSLHAKCIPIPEKIKDDHIHRLTYTKPVVTGEDFKRHDNLQECYCHKCETERDPRFPYYNCEICPYNAHIGCIVSETSSQEMAGKANGEEGSKDEGTQENQGLHEDRLSKLTEEISNVKKETEEKTTELKIEEAELEVLITMLEELKSDRDMIIEKRLVTLY